MAGTDDSARALFAAYRRLLRAAREFRAAIETAACANQLALPDALLVLYLIEEQRGDACGIIQKQLAEQLAMSTAQASARLESLRQRALVSGVRGINDRRKQFWSLTTSGCQLGSRLQAELAHAMGSSARKSLDVLIQDLAKAAEPRSRHRDDSREAA